MVHYNACGTKDFRTDEDRPVRKANQGVVSGRALGTANKHKGSVLMSGYHKRDWETFPMDKLHRVDRPTTRIDEGKVQRVRERESGFMKAAVGDYGPVLQREFRRFVPKHPLSGPLAWMRTVHEAPC